MVRSYLRQRRGVLLTFLLFGGLFAVTFALYSLPVQAVAYPFLLCAVAGSIPSIITNTRSMEINRFFIVRSS